MTFEERQKKYRCAICDKKFQPGQMMVEVLRYDYPNMYDEVDVKINRYFHLSHLKDLYV